MKKSIITASILALGITSVSAMDLEIFVGVEGSITTTNSTLSVTSGLVEEMKGGNVARSFSVGESQSENSMGLGFGLKAGAILNKNHRIYANITDYSNLELLNSDLALQTYTLNYDYMFTGDSKATPFLGVHGGMANAEFFGDSDMSAMYGVQGGIIVDITDNIEWEMGMTYSMLTSKPTTGLKSGNDIGGSNWRFTNANAEIELKDMFKPYLSLNYKF